MKIVRSIAAVRAWRSELDPVATVGFVPTMGAFHEGHRALMGRGRAESDALVVSVFVNPKQFAVGEDLASYPSEEASDIAAAEAEGVDLLWFGSSEELYPPGFETRVQVPALDARLCGLSRPDHFAGVVLVVLKLLHITQPARAYFGRKDYQQLQLVQRMVRDLDLSVHIVGCPVIRSPDGLALSSRHQRLSAVGLQGAAAIPAALRRARAAFAAGENRAPELVLTAVRVLTSAAGVELEYVELVDPDSLAPLSVGDATSVLVLAARVEGVRLIDNSTLAGTDTLGDEGPLGREGSTA